MPFHHDGHEPEQVTDGSANHGEARPRRSVPPGKSTLTSRLGASPASIAREVVAQLQGTGTDAAAPAAAAPPVVQARGDLAGPDVHAIAAEGTAGRGGPLPFLDEIQRAFGHHDVAGVRAHVGGAAAEASTQIGAVAYAAGDDVAFSQTPDLRLAAHEAAHVVQQRGGVRLSDGLGRAGDEYERHADAVADAVVRGDSAESLLDGMAHRGASGGPAVQRTERSRAPVEDSALALDEIPRDPDPAELLARLRAQIQQAAEAENVPIPDAALAELESRIAALLDAGGPGPVTCAPEQVESRVAGIDYTWRLGGRLTHGAPRDPSSASGRGTVTTSDERESTAQSQQTDQVTNGERGQLSGSAGRDAGNAGGQEYAAGGQYEQTEQRQSTRQNTRGGQRTRGASTALETRVRLVDYLVDVSLALDYRLELASSSAMNQVDAGVSGIGGLLGRLTDRSSAATTRMFSPTTGRVGPDVIGSIQQHHSRVDDTPEPSGRRRR